MLSPESRSALQCQRPRACSIYAFCESYLVRCADVCGETFMSQSFGIIANAKSGSARSPETERVRPVEPRLKL